MRHLLTSQSTVYQSCDPPFSPSLEGEVQTPPPPLHLSIVHLMLLLILVAAGVVKWVPIPLLVFLDDEEEEENMSAVDGNLSRARTPCQSADRPSSIWLGRTLRTTFRPAEDSCRTTLTWLRPHSDTPFTDTSSSPRLSWPAAARERGCKCSIRSPCHLYLTSCTAGFNLRHHYRYPVLDSSLDAEAEAALASLQTYALCSSNAVHRATHVEARRTHTRSLAQCQPHPTLVCII